MATQVASLFAKISADTKDFERGMSGVQTMLGKAGDGLVAIGKAAVVAGIAVGAALTTVIVKSTQSAIDMEQAMANVQSAMSLSADETARLKALVKDLGLDPRLQVTATEAAREMAAKEGRNG